MKVLHVVPSLDISQGGPSKSVSDLAIHQSKLGIDVSIITTISDKPYLENNNSFKVKVNFVSRKGFRSSLICLMQDHNFDLLHGHGIWQLPVHYMSQEARKRGIPYLITPRGMLEPWSLNQGKLKKRIALFVYQRKDLEKAEVIHATSEMEAKNIKNLRIRNSVEVIPNGVDISEFSKKFPHKSEFPKKILFLSRIHRKKGIELLIDAWFNLSETLKENWIIEIVGNGESSYINSLNQKIKGLHLEKQIIIKPPVYNNEKNNFFRTASLFVLPTYSENFGIVIAEALANYTPVITTKGTPWEDLIANNAGWWIKLSVENLQTALVNAMTTDEVDLFEMGKNGRELIEKKYSMNAVSMKAKKLYQDILVNRKI